MSQRWRIARDDDTEDLVEMSMALSCEDPGIALVDREGVLRTLDTFRREPYRGRAVVCELDGMRVGYALLVPFWSNELGGNVCEIDELYVRPAHRGRGHGSALIGAIDQLWDGAPVALALGVTDDNPRARALYERLGFRRVGTTMVRR